MFPRYFFYHDLTLKKPRILISACLCGDAVRYDGLHKSTPELACFFADHADVFKVCPEVGAGFGVPRPPVALHLYDKGIRAVGVENPALDVTDDLAQFAHEFASGHDHFHGVILKSRSPSCGFGSTPVYQSGSQYLGNGIFAQAISEQWTQCLISEDTSLASRQDFEDFLLGCHVIMDIRQTRKEDMGLLRQHYASLFSREISLERRCQAVSGFFG